MELKFNEKKAIQIVALLLKKNDGRMDLLRLTKLMYLIDREALLRWGLPLTGDRYASMENGMVLSATYDLSKRKDLNHRVWYDYISAPDHNHIMNLLQDPDDDELSEEDIEMIDEIYETYKDTGTYRLIKQVHHELPEWVDVGKSSVIVHYEEVLKKNGVEGEILESRLEDLEDYSYFQKFSV